MCSEAMPPYQSCRISSSDIIRESRGHHKGEGVDEDVDNDEKRKRLTPQINGFSFQVS